jgi:hypothetical protein
MIIIFILGSLFIICQFLLLLVVKLTANSHIDAMRHLFPQNYKTLLIHPNMSKENFSMPE